MAGSARRLTLGELEERFRGAKDVVERSHCQAIWLLAKRHSTAEVAELVALSRRWVSQLRRRCDAEGADALGDRRRRNAGARPLLSADDLEALRERLRTPPDDGGIWSGPKVAWWIAARRGLVHVHAPRGWEALRKLGWSLQAPRGLVHVHAPRGWEALRKLGWSLQAPRPKKPGAAAPEEADAFKNVWPAPSAS